MRYTATLDRKLLVQAEVEQKFSDLNTAVNTTKLAPGDFDKMAVEYRNLQRPPKFGLAQRARPIALSAGSWGGWYQVTNLTVKHAQVSAFGLSAHDGTKRPTVEVSGALGLVGGCGTVAGGITKCTIGVSTDGGVSWQALDGTGGTKSAVREFGDNSGSAIAYYAAPTQNHYLLGTPNYFPVDYPVDRAVQVLASFGGDEGSFRTPVGLNAYCLMVDAPLQNVVQGSGWLTLDAREKEF
jgi:hypothetical protein